jgi:hypothetical protein
LTLLTERYAIRSRGCFPAGIGILLFGTLPKICYAEGMTSYLYEQTGEDLRLSQVRRTVSGHAARERRAIGGEAGIEIEFLRKRNVRKEDLVKQVLAKRGEHPGLVCILSAMEPAPPTSRGTTKTPARRSCCRTTASACTTTSISSTKNWGLCYVRVPTWLPCRLQDLFQRAQLAGRQVAQAQDRVPIDRQCLRGDRRLEARAAVGQRAGDPAASRQTG